MTTKYNKYLIAGATGGTGRELVKQLISLNKQVAIIVRNKTKAREVFKDIYKKISDVIECNLGESQFKPYIKEEENKVINALEGCDVLVSAIGSVRGQDPQISDYMTTTEMIRLCERTKDKFKGKPFVLVSSLYVERPYSFVAYFLNTLVPYVLGWKILAENKLRQSDLNYLIVRPGRLTNDKEITNAVGVYQGDRVKGKISRRNTACAIIQALNLDSINKGRVTIDVVECNTPTANEDKAQLEITQLIKEDDENSISTADHFVATRNISVCLYTILFLGILFIILKYK